MSSSPLPPNPSLVAIILVVKFYNEPQIIFHYPPRPGEDNSHYKNYLASDLTDDASTSSSDDESTKSSDERSKLEAQVEPSQNGNSPDAGVDEAGSVSPEKHDGVNPARLPRWNDIFGFPSATLAKLLCPVSSNHKKRFEMGIDGKVFLGWPIYKREGRGWQRKRRPRKSKSTDNRSHVTEGLGQGERTTTSGRTSAVDNGEVVETSGQESDTEDGANNQETKPVGDDCPISKETSSQSHGAPGDSNSWKDTTETKLKDILDMFHVVFVLDPPPLEYHLRVDEMYSNVVKKFSRALNWEQARSNYTAREASAISVLNRYSGKTVYAHASKSLNLTCLGPKQPLAPLYHKLLSQSSLAKAISTLYNNLSSSRIAHISLTPPLSLSLQIPIPTSTSVFPNLISPQLPGLWLTTATSIPTDDDVNDTGSELAAQFTLLLLTDLSTILADINATASPLTAPLTQFLRVSKPTKSFLQISQSSGISLPDIQFLASHLIYWRRARAIPPLHQCDTYIVSPNADMSKIGSATSAFAKRFHALPSLPKILSLLSFTPRPWSTLIPSKDHKEAYMDILAWLLWGGWVTQLRTFAWVRVPQHIKVAVEVQSEEKPHTRSADDKDETVNKTQTFSLDPPSPTSSTHTTFPFPSHHRHTSPSVIPNPHLAFALPSRYLSAISKHILENQGADAQLAWDRIVKYFDGRHAIETIATREGWKRKRIGDLVAGWEAEGLLIRGRHW